MADIEVRLWTPGTSEQGLMGFDTKQARDAYARGEPGPFPRRVRPADWPPPSIEHQALQAFLDGTLSEFMVALAHEGTPQ